VLQELKLGQVPEQTHVVVLVGLLHQAQFCRALSSLATVGPQTEPGQQVLAYKQEQPVAKQQPELALEPELQAWGPL
jgi:hypothetical protein